MKKPVKRKEKRKEKKKGTEVKTASVFAYFSANTSVRAPNCLCFSFRHGHVLIFVELDSDKEQGSQHICKMILQCWLHGYYCGVCHLYNIVEYIS
jgi:hypothetical protein